MIAVSAQSLVLARCLGVSLMLALGACATKPKAPSTAATKPGGYYQDDGPSANPPANLDQIADATPRNERYHSGANKPYTVLGRSYVPVINNDAFRQEGIASWYGKQVHGKPTSIGETYDMNAMTAAHPTLPLPSYVRVSNPANARAVVVRVNDRGPFHADRIIDLSYVAAAKLGIIARGSGRVIVERVFAGEPQVAIAAPAPTPSLISVSPITTDAGELYLQLGAFSSAENAEQFRTRVAAELDWNREPVTITSRDRLHRVRMGPYKSRDDAEAMAKRVSATLHFSPVISKP